MSICLFQFCRKISRIFSNKRIRRHLTVNKSNRGKRPVQSDYQPSRVNVKEREGGRERREERKKGERGKLVRKERERVRKRDKMGERKREREAEIELQIYESEEDEM